MNFDQVHDRRGTNCIKVDFAEEFNHSKDLIPLWVADMDFQAPDEVIAALTKAAQFGIYGYSDIKEDYRAAVTGWFEKHFGWRAQKDWLVITPGVVFAINLAIRAFTKPGDPVLIQRPVYGPFPGSIRQNGRRIVSSDLRYENGRYEMDFADFEQKIVENGIKLFILCSPHNPVGRVWTREELERVAQICLRHDVLVVSDEIHCDFTWPEHPHTVFATLPGMQDRCVICTAPSKTFNLAGLQTSNIFIPNEELRKAFVEERQNTSFHEPNLFGLYGCQAAYEHGEAWLSSLREYLAQNQAYVADYLKAHIPEIKMTGWEGTYLLWLDCSGLGLSDQELEAFLTEKAGLWLNAGTGFSPDCGQFERFNMASPKSVIERAMEQLGKAVEELRRERA